MKVQFNKKEYKKNGRNGTALKDLCFDIFKHYLSEHTNLIYFDIQKIFNNRHGTNNYVVLNQEDWEEKTVDAKNGYFAPIKYNNEKLYFTTQWGNNGGESDNINNMINFAQEQGYDISKLENNNIFYGLWLARDKNPQDIIDSGVWINNLSNISRIEKQLNKLKIGDEVFLYQSEKDLKTKNTPFSNYLTDEYKFMEDKTIVEVTSWAIGKVKNINADNRKVEIDWNKHYIHRKWYVFYRQDGIWELNLNTSNILRGLKYEALYNIVFNEEEQNYKWWIDNKIFDRYKNNNFSTNINSINTKNIILYGSPGVGKTHNTNKLIRLIEDGKGDREIFESIKLNEKSDSVDISDIKERVKFVTFHQSFGYEDFIEGFRPNENGDIELVDGIFKEICKNADKDRDNKYYLVIDEINRGNISKIFGELITLIEEDKRDNLEVTLPYSKQAFKIPSNLYIIGTMNSTDKSIALIDIALRRRFTFLKMKPNETLIAFPRAKEIFIALNEQIAKDLGEDYQIGHSYFMKIADDNDLDFVLDYKITPLLEEYYYEDDKLKNIINLVK